MVIVEAQYVKPYTVDLVVQRKFVTNINGNFTVADINGNMMFKIKDTRFSFHDRHILYDATEKPVLTFKKKLRSIHGRWLAFKGDSKNHKDLLFSVKKSSTPKYNTKLDVFLVENKEETTSDYKVTCDWEMKSCSVYGQDGSTILAEVEHGKDTFGITVYPEVDYVFIVALVVILTEIKTYDSSGKKKKRKTKKKDKKKKKNNSDSSNDDDAKIEKYNEEMEQTGNFEGNTEQEEDEEEEEEEDKDEDDNDDVDGEEDEEEEYDVDDDDYDVEDNDYGDESYNQEPKFDKYDDDDDEVVINDNNESSSSEDDSPPEK